MHLVGFIIRIYHDARSSECQISNLMYGALLTKLEACGSCTICIEFGTQERFWGHAVAQLVEALRRKPEGHRFDS